MEGYFRGLGKTCSGLWKVCEDWWWPFKAIWAIVPFLVWLMGAVLVFAFAWVWLLLIILD